MDPTTAATAAAALPKSTLAARLEKREAMKRNSMDTNPGDQGGNSIDIFPSLAHFGPFFRPIFGPFFRPLFELALAVYQVGHSVVFIPEQVFLKNSDF